MRDAPPNHGRFADAFLQTKSFSQIDLLQTGIILVIITTASSKKSELDVAG
jgi:hypothetical protein